MAIEEEIRSILGDEKVLQKMTECFQLREGGNFLCYGQEDKIYSGQIVPENTDDLFEAKMRLPHIFEFFSQKKGDLAKDAQKYITARVLDYVGNYNYYGSNPALSSGVFLVRGVYDLLTLTSSKNIVKAMDSPLHPSSFYQLLPGISSLELHELARQYFPVTLLNCSFSRKDTAHILAIRPKQRNLNRKKVLVAASTQLQDVFPHINTETSEKYYERFHGWLNLKSKEI